MSINLSSFLITLVLLLVFLQLVSKLFKKAKQPKVIGEMFAGILLGPSFFGLLAPDLQNKFFSPDVLMVLSVLSNIGLTLYMFLIGLKLDFKHFKREQFKSSIFVLVLGFFPSILLGGTTVYFMMEQLSDNNKSLVEIALFVGLAMSITAFPVVVRILNEKQIVNTNVGVLTIMIAGMEDVVAWILLALLLSFLHDSNLLQGIMTVIGTVSFTLFVFYIVKPLLKRIGEKVEQNKKILENQFAVIIFIVLAGGALTDFIGVHTVFGGFIIGVAMPRKELFQREVTLRLESLVVVLLIPIFFVCSGMNTNLMKIVSNTTLILPLITVIIVSFVGKYGFSVLSLRKIGYSWRESSAIGGLLNARGVMGLIVANIGLTEGILSQEIFTILIVMVIITTLCASPIYNISMGKK